MRSQEKGIRELGKRLELGKKIDKDVGAVQLWPQLDPRGSPGALMVLRNCPTSRKGGKAFTPQCQSVTGIHHP